MRKRNDSYQPMYNPDWPIYDVSEFTFGSPPGRSYLVYEPQNREEIDRFRALIGTEKIIDRLLEERPKKKPLAEGEIEDLLAYEPVGYTTKGEIISVIIEGEFKTKKIGGQLKATFGSSSIIIKMPREEKALQEFKEDWDKWTKSHKKPPFFDFSFGTGKSQFSFN